MSFGTDTWCADRLSTGRLARGKYVLAQALYRRTITQRGTLLGGEEESTYGLDVAEFIGAVDNPGALDAQLRAEFLKDDRVADVDVRSTRTVDLDGRVSYAIESQVVPADATEPFTLTLAASEVGTQLLGVV